MTQSPKPKPHTTKRALNKQDTTTTSYNLQSSIFNLQSSIIFKSSSMAIVASLPNHNLFTSLPKTPKTTTQQPSPPSFSPPIPPPKYPPKPKKSKTPSPHNHPAFTKIPHNKTKYYKPISPTTPQFISPPSSSIQEDFESPDTDDRTIVIGDSGVSYLLPGAPFEFKFSYSETPKAKPLAIREPPFLPFAPPSMPRPWTGKAPLKSKAEKLLKKKNVPLFDSSNPYVKKFDMKNPWKLGEYSSDGRSRREILGEPLSRAEIKALVQPMIKDNRQVNLGRDGLTHNMLELIHSHWKRRPVCKVKCKGVPTVDMDNICRCIEEKAGGKIIYRTGGIVYLYRGRNYNYRTRPKYPVMLWKPAAPVYPKLIQDAPEGLTKQEADEFRQKGKTLLAICKLAKNGVYITLVNEVRQAFEGSEVVKIDCRGLEPSDYKKIGAKLKELVPCVLLSFDDEQILMWRGHDWKSMYPDSLSLLTSSDTVNGFDNSNSGETKKVIPSPRMMSLWQRALESNKAALLDETDLGPDELLERVEEFDRMTQATEHSYPALVHSGEGSMSNSESKDAYFKDDEEFDNYSTDEEDKFEDSEDDPFGDAENPGPLGSLPVDILAKRLSEHDEY